MKTEGRKLSCEKCGNTSFSIYRDLRHPVEEGREPLVLVECTKCLMQHIVEVEE